MTASAALDPTVAIAAASVRMLALFMVAPIFGHTSLPIRVRVALALVVTWAVGVAPIPQETVDAGFNRA